MSQQRIEEKLDKLQEDVTDIKVTLGKQHITLVEHESRSTKLESIVLPLQKKANMLEGILKFLGILSIFIGIIEALKRF